MDKDNPIIEKEIKLIELEIFKTTLKKNQFIQEMKNGLGNEIKNNKEKFIRVHTPWNKKIIRWIKKIFTKF